MDTFNAVWEEDIYSQGNQLNRYPYSSVVSFLFRNYPRQKKKEEINILEVGCGAGNNLWFAAREGFKVTGIDGSESAIAYSKKRFKKDKLEGEFLVGDFSNLPFKNAQFDIVIDRAALCCVNLDIAQKAIQEINRVLVKDGLFFFTPYSQHHISFASGILQPDGMVSEIEEGLIGVGSLCFYSYKDLLTMFEKKWRIKSIQHKTNQEVFHANRYIHAEWEAIVAKTD